MSTGVQSPTFNPAEPIPGYLVQERIGAGGYGEVWRAQAPGGIAKAIKIVFGYHDDERATRELTSLNRIKEVRHPFLLSLERIELVDGHLVIVTELATASMKNLFEQFRESGSAGIPRAELLTHLRDAADALDYICQEHSLQHLDIKPENMLLVGGRVKVADFGLVKDLQDVNCSMMGGLTPVYASPELFDGRPNIHSDQYSLAIVYQEMLTGVLPFAGRTTAQLAAQHLHSRPRLDFLPPADQATIARALSKDPQQRFPTCRAMVDSLLGATASARPASASAIPPSAYRSSSAPMKTEVLRYDELDTESAGTSGGSLSRPLEPPMPPSDLPPLELKPENLLYRPTIVIGIGGLASKTLQSLQRRLVDRFGDLHAVPALQILLFDTDAEALSKVASGDSPDSIGNDAAILLPLRPAADYRRDSSNHSRWLNRRWMFNIPRSLQTQGFRPLGRLALVDHYDRVLERTQRAIHAAVDPKAISESARQTGLPFSDLAPQVFIVSSISGGTGSGMLLDVAYLVRKILRDSNLPEDKIYGLLAHCTARNPQLRELAVANSCALLTELNHFNVPHHSYPGDPSCGLPSFAPEDPPFSQSYVVNLGEELEAKDFASAADTLAGYLYCNMATSAGGFFDQCRATSSSEGQPAGIRTFGLSRLGFSDDDIPTAAADELCAAMVMRLRGTDRQEAEEKNASLSDPNSLLVTKFAAGQCEAELRAEVATRAEAAGVDVQRILGELYAAAIEAMGTEPEAYLVNVLEELASQSGSKSLKDQASARTIVDTLDSLICNQDNQSSKRVCLESVLAKPLAQMAAGQSASLRAWILSLVASPKHRVQGAQRATDYVVDYLRNVSHEVGESSQTPRTELRTLQTALLSEKAGNREWLRYRGFSWRRKLVVDQQLAQYFHLKIKDLILNSICRLVGQILAELAALDDRLRNLAADLNRLAEGFTRLSKARAADPAQMPRLSENARRVVVETISKQKAEMLTEMEHELEDELHRVAANDRGEAACINPRILRRTAHTIILRTLRKVSLREITIAEAGKSCEPIFSLADGLKSATPWLNQCGGARRLLLLAPETSSRAKLVAQLGEECEAGPTVVGDKENDVVLCYETEQLSLPRVAATILDQRFQVAEVAARLHTRTDVHWTPL
jgi:serine/threonine protein kinase